ncbi:MAG: DNA-3-methyladenine glycosylase family protein [Bacillota bacterium]
MSPKSQDRSLKRLPEILGEISHSDSNPGTTSHNCQKSLTSTRAVKPLDLPAHVKIQGSCDALDSLGGFQIEFDGPLDLESTLECGQVFRWGQASGPDGYTWHKGVIGSCALMVRFNTGSSNLLVLHDKELGSFESKLGQSQIKLANKVLHYFSLDDDLKAISSYLTKRGSAARGIVDPVIKEAIRHARGLRILRQDPWECLVSYIVSTNKNIPAICKIVRYFCKTLGLPAGLGEYTFPSPEAFLAAGHDCISDSKCGYRASYVLDAAEKVAGNQVNLDFLRSLPVDNACQELRKIKGVGPKVADCVLLFGYHRLDVFPVDVWIARAMSRFYFDGREISPAKAREEGMKRFGLFAGYAQEYLFHYARNVLDKT